MTENIVRSSFLLKYVTEYLPHIYMDIRDSEHVYVYSLNLTRCRHCISF
jgi:hypothetical protein